MKSLYLYFKFLFSDDEQLIATWNHFSDRKVHEKYKGAVAKEFQKRGYRLEGVNWVKPSP